MKNTIKLFNAVLSPELNSVDTGSYKVLYKYGVILDPRAACSPYAQVELDQEGMLTNAFNQTFHKSWDTVIKTSREDLAVHQILHYLSTYGTDMDDRFIYIPREVLNTPEPIKFRLIVGLAPEEMANRAFKMLASGTALKTDTVTTVLEILKDLNFHWNQERFEAVKNKEARIKLCDEYALVPSDPVEIVRMFLYYATGSTLLIKSKAVKKLLATEASLPNPKLQILMSAVTAETLAPVFNRFKPIFMGLKTQCPSIRSKINLISKLSKTLHKPMRPNILNELGLASLSDLRAAEETLFDHATFAQLARGLQYLSQTLEAKFAHYQIRNGKSWTKDKKAGSNANHLSKMVFLSNLISRKFGDSVRNKTFYIPAGVEYALPTSEKSMIGPIPAGSKFTYADAVSVGVHWRNSGGARDIDVSAVGLEKTGWNSVYSRNNGSCVYSGDITNAPDGATEYIRVSKAHSETVMIRANIFSGDDNAKYTIVLGQGSETDKAYMMDPNLVDIAAPAQSVSVASAVAIVVPNGDSVTAIMAHFGDGNARVSTTGPIGKKQRKALVHKWTNCWTVNQMLRECGAQVITQSSAGPGAEAAIDLSPRSLAVDTLLNLFSSDK